MNRFFRISSVLALCLSVLSSYALAVEPDPVTDIAPELQEEVPIETISSMTDAAGNVTINVNVPATSEAAAEDPAAIPEDPDAAESSEGAEAPVIESLYTVRTLDAENPVSVSLPSVVESLFGTYTPRTQTVTEFLSDGSTVTYTEIVPGVAGLDYQWLASAGLFALSLYCVFRMIGGMFKWA